VSVLISSYSESNNGTSNVSVGASGIVTADGQSFSVGPRDLTLDSAKFYIKKVNSPTGSCYARVYAMAGVYGSTSIPTGSALAVSDAVDVASLGTSYALVEFAFSGANRIALSATVKYFVCFEFAGGDGSNYAHIAPDTTSPTHPGNNCWKAGGGWTAVGSQDLPFYVYGVPADETLLLIDGYSEGNVSTTGSSYSGATAQHDGNSFANTSAILLTKAYMLLAKSGSPTGTVVAKLWSHTGTYGGTDGKPGTLLATSDTVDVSTLAAYSDVWAMRFVEFTFSGAQVYALAASTNYCITIEYAAGNSSNYVRTGLDSSSPTHGGRRVYSTNGTSWTAQSGAEFCFFVYGTTGYHRSLDDTITLQDNDAGRMLAALDSQFVLSDELSSLLNRRPEAADSMVLSDALSVEHYDSWKRVSLADELILVDQRDVAVEEVPTLEVFPISGMLSEAGGELSLGHGYLVDVIGPSADGTEQRALLRNVPVHEVSYGIADLGDREARMLASLVHRSHQDWVVPVWPWMVRLAEATVLDSHKVYVPSAWLALAPFAWWALEFAAGSLYVVFWRGFLAFEKRRVTGSGSDGGGSYLSIEDGPTVWAVGSMLVPAFVGRLTSVEAESRDGPQVRSARVTLTSKGTEVSP